MTNVTEAWTDQFVEVIGMVQSADTVQAQTSKSFGNNFGLFWSFFRCVMNL